jgi:hypothetical protein
MSAPWKNVDDATDAPHRPPTGPRRHPLSERDVARLHAAVEARLPLAPILNTIRDE